MQTLVCCIFFISFCFPWWQNWLLATVSRSQSTQQSESLNLISNICMPPSPWRPLKQPPSLLYIIKLYSGLCSPNLLFHSVSRWLFWAHVKIHCFHCHAPAALTPQLNGLDNAVSNITFILTYLKSEMEYNCTKYIYESTVMKHIVGILVAYASLNLNSTAFCRQVVYFHIYLLTLIHICRLHVASQPAVHFKFMWFFFNILWLLVRILRKKSEFPSPLPPTSDPTVQSIDAFIIIIKD